MIGQIIPGLINLLTNQWPATDPVKQAVQTQLAAAVGANAFPNKSPQATQDPRLILHKIRGEHVTHMQGRGGQAAPMIAIVAYALDAKTANTVGDLARQLLDGYRGPSGAAGQSPTILGCFLEDDSDEYLPPAHDDEIGVHSTPWLFKVVHTEN